MTRPDDVRVRHMIEAAQKAIEFCHGRSRGDLDSDELLRLALTKLVEIVGEAAKQVSEETRKGTPASDGAEAARVRDRLVHHYFDINIDVLWATVREELPALVEAIGEPGPAS